MIRRLPTFGVALAALLSTVAAPAQAAEGRYFHGVYASFAGVRDHHGYVPSAYRPGTPTPLLVALHGCTENSFGFDLLTGFSALAEERGFIVVFPEQSTLANPAQCWNWTLPSNQHRGLGEPSIIAGITQRVRSQYTVDSARTYVTGVSAGAVMRARSVPVLVFQGTADAVAESVVRDAVPGGRTYTRSVYRGPGQGSLPELYMIDGAGHSYPGGCSCSLSRAG